LHGLVVKTTIHDIAQKLNINAATVSRALNNHPAVSDKTKKAVLRTAKRLHYQPNNIASSLLSGKSKILGVIIPSAEINFFGFVIHGIERAATENDYNVLIFQSNELLAFEEKGVETLLRSRVEGVLASMTKETTSFDNFNQLKKRGVPLVLFDRVNETVDVPSIVVDDYKGAYMATEHLIQQGYTSIAHIGGQKHVHIWQEWLRGYKDALKDNGMPVIKGHITHGEVSIESGMKCMTQLLQYKHMLDAVFAVEDFTALGALKVLKEKRIDVPSTIGLVGFANKTFGAYLTPSLSTVDQQTIRMGEEVAQLFFELSASGNFFKESVKKVLEPKLIVHDSSVKNTSK
jgi:LacI family transcriptional regulator